LPIEIDPKRSILLKIKLNMTPHLFLIENDNFSMWITHAFPTLTDMASDIPNKMGAAISHMTMMVIGPFSMIKMDVDTMKTTAAMSFHINMITSGH
jgi:hypothetical protein